MPFARTLREWIRDALSPPPAESTPELTPASLIARFGACASPYFGSASKPYVRWWWLAGPFRPEDAVRQLEWVRQNGFGGVELAWLDPVWLGEQLRNEPRPAWLGEEWSASVAFTKKQAAALGLGCDFTFGSCWPFGGSWLYPEDASQTFDGLSSQRLEGSWERSAYVVNHLSSEALSRYAAPLARALEPALAGGGSALFCDSLELVTERLWSPALWEVFERRFGYALQPFANELHAHPAVRYDYRSMIADTIRREFYEAFTALAQRRGSYSRVQCHGAPTDLLRAYAAVDVPESETLLFPPAFSRIAASAAAWAGKPIVSAETFTCIYGFPGVNPISLLYWKKENVADLKLLADSIFANGVNQIVWHGMPYQPADRQVEFYASVHVGPDSPFAPQLPEFNAYLEQVSALLKLGNPYGGLGLYLPNEDARMLDRIPSGERTPGANYRWEMRQAAPPAATEGFAPLWISQAFLQEAQCNGGRIQSRSLSLEGLYIDCEWLDADSLKELLRLARQGAQIVWKHRCRQPGRSLDPRYEENLQSVLAQPNVTAELSSCEPLLSGDDLPWYWARIVENDLLLFFSHPKTKEIRFPMSHGFSLTDAPVYRTATLHWKGRQSSLALQFDPYQSVMLLVSERGTVQTVDIRYAPPLPATEVKSG